LKDVLAATGSLAEGRLVIDEDGACVGIKGEYDKDYYDPLLKLLFLRKPAGYINYYFSKDAPDCSDYDNDSDYYVYYYCCYYCGSIYDYYYY